MTSNVKGISQCLISVQGADRSIRWSAANKTANSYYSLEKSSANINYYCRQILCLTYLLVLLGKRCIQVWCCGSVVVLLKKFVTHVTLFRTLRKESHYSDSPLTVMGLGSSQYAVRNIKHNSLENI